MNKTPKLRFKEFSGNWENKKLGDLSDLITKGTTPSSIGFSFIDEGINFIKTENIDKNGYIRIDETPKISEECNEKLSRSVLNEGDILFSIAGTLGRTCLIENKHLPANTNQALSIVRLSKNISNKYVNSYLNLDKIKRYIDISVSVGAQPNINLQQVGDIKINIPSIAEQEKIASFFSLIDDKISLQSEKVNALKDYKSGMMQKIFSRELRFKDDDGRDYPEWEDKRFKDFVKINQGLQIPISDRYTTNGENRYFYITNEFLKSSSENKYYIENPSESVICYEDDILMTRTGNTGKVVTGVKGAFHNNFFKISYDKSKYNQMFLYYVLTSHKMQKNIIRLAGTSTIPDLNHGDFYNIKVNLPIKKEQNKISKLLMNLDTKIEKEQEKLDSLNEYKKGLLQQMFV